MAELLGIISADFRIFSWCWLKMPPYLAKSCRETELRWSPPKRTPNLLSAKAANTLLWSAVIPAGREYFWMGWQYSDDKQHVLLLAAISRWLCTDFSSQGQYVGYWMYCERTCIWCKAIWWRRNIYSLRSKPNLLVWCQKHPKRNRFDDRGGFG